MLNHQFKENAHSHYKYSIEDSPSPKARKFGDNVNRQIAQSKVMNKSIELKPYLENNNEDRLQPIKMPEFRTTAINISQRKLGSTKELGQRDQRDSSRIKNEGNFRRRDFQMRVNNIEMMSQQISGLLDYVNKPTNKSPYKQKDIEYSYLKYTKFENQKPQNNESGFEKMQYRYKQDNIQLGEYNENKKSYNFSKQQNSSELKSYRYKKRYEVIDSYNRQTQLIKRQQNSQDKNRRKHNKSPITKLKMNLEIENSDRDYKYTDRKYTPKKSYEYALQNEQNSIESSQQKYDENKKRPNAQTNRKEQRQNLYKREFENQIKGDICTQIQKIRERIKSSEKRTYNMEKRYLKNNTTRKDNNYMVQSKVVSNFQVKNIHKSNHQQIRDNRPQFKIQLKPIQQPHQVYDRNRQQPKTNRSVLDSLDCDKRTICSKITKAFIEQINLDKKLRIQRDNFSRRSDPQKWKKLKYCLQRKGCFNYSEKQLEKQLQIASNQIDPFADQIQLGTNSYQMLAQCFIACQNHWQKQISCIISKYENQASNFSTQEIDLSSKGYITVEDLVCFVNMHGYTNFRNRDLLALYRRFMALSSRREGIQMKAFIKKIVG